MAARARARAAPRPARRVGPAGARARRAAAIAFAIFIVVSGGWVFAGGAFVLGVLCLHELFRMYEALRPVKLAGFLALAGLAVAAQLGRRAPGAAGRRRVRAA